MLSQRSRHAPLAALALYLLCGCTPAAPQPCPTCAAAKRTNQWCDRCKVGYVAGTPIRSKVLFDALDAHGHVLDLSSIKCEQCQNAIAHEGFCETCRIGWHLKQAYFSRLTYHVSRGVVRPDGPIACSTCRQNATRYGWCDACALGSVGNVEFRDRADFDGACRGYDLMMAADEASRRCETCALAILTDTSCFYCKVTYKEGRPVAKKS